MRRDLARRSRSRTTENYFIFLPFKEIAPTVIIVSPSFLVTALCKSDIFALLLFMVAEKLEWKTLILWTHGDMCNVWEILLGSR